MKLLVLISAALAVACSERDYEAEEKEYHLKKGTMFKEHLFPFNKRLALEANYYSKGHFIVSAHSIWYKLATLAESLKTGEHQDIISYLNLPDQEAVRQQFYSLSLMIEGSGRDISVTRSHAIALDETVDIEEDWHTFDFPAGMPSYLNSVTFNKPFGKVQNYVSSTQSDIPYSSHTVLVDHLMFDGLWNSGFSDKATQQGPFYNDQGEQIATVEYLRMNGRIRVAHSPDKKVKVVEIPVGSEGNLAMLLAVGDKVETMIEAVFSGDIFSQLKLTEESVEIAIPRLSMSSAMDMAPIFKNIRRSNEFTDPAATRRVSNTPASPLGYFQIVSVNITDSVGSDESSSLTDVSDETDFASGKIDGFIINRPFLFTLFVPLYMTDIKVPMFTGVYSYPGERGQQRIFD